MGVSSELVDGVLVITPTERKSAPLPVVALYYITLGQLVIFSLPREYTIDVADVLRLLKPAGYPLRQRRHLWHVTAWKGQPFTITLPDDQLQFGCRVPSYAALLDAIDDYNDRYQPDDGFYVSQLVTV